MLLAHVWAAIGALASGLHRGTTAKRITLSAAGSIFSAGTGRQQLLVPFRRFQQDFA